MIWCMGTAAQFMQGIWEMWAGMTVGGIAPPGGHEGGVMGHEGGHLQEGKDAGPQHGVQQGRLGGHSGEGGKEGRGGGPEGGQGPQGRDEGRGHHLHLQGRRGDETSKLV